jgi:hypothetical protein
MTDDERDHLFHLAGQAAPARAVRTSHLSPGMQHVLDRLTDTPAFVVDDLGVTVFQNPMSVAVSGDASRFSGPERSFAWRWFTDPATRARYPEEDWPVHSRTHVADLRATHGRRGSDPDVAAVVDGLLAASPEFAALWAEHEVAVRRADTKRIIHPEVGLLDLLCETLISGVDGQTLVVLFPRPGSDAREKLDLLRVIGTQEFSARTSG